ncbi:hypothetical protein M422DRAFT_24408 [Sphaerobolus stellatus SS14]|nr:hypothetical protein M422DRAFT_24408 [Sphaerobolus stellatus SS14]
MLAFTSDLFNGTGILSNIAALTVVQNDGRYLEAHIYKVNAYSAGGFFKSHRDTPKPDRYIGTIVVGLPNSFEGVSSVSA